MIMLSRGCPRRVGAVASRSLERGAKLVPTPSSRHGTNAVCTIQRTARQVPSGRRHISLWPWRQQPQPSNLPLYFSSPTAAPKYRYRAGMESLGRVVFAGVVFYICAKTYFDLVFNPLFDLLEQEYEELSDEDKATIDKEMAEEGHDALFLPFPFTRTLVQDPPYKSSDPEWVMYVKVNKDKKWQQEIRSSLAELTRRRIATDPRLLQVLGGSDIKVRRQWLDILYPPLPPPHYHVWGFAIADDGLFWGERHMHRVAGNTLDRILGPKAMASAIWAFSSTFCSVAIHQAASSMGLVKEQEPNWAVTRMMRLMKNSSPGLASQADVLAGALGNDLKSRAKLDGFRKEHGKADGTNLFLEDYFSSIWRTASLAATSKFTMAYREQLTNEPPPPRGCIKVQGSLEFQGSQAFLRAQVEASYNPVRREFVNVKTVVKHVLKHRQTPAD